MFNSMAAGNVVVVVLPSMKAYTLYRSYSRDKQILVVEAISKIALESGKAPFELMLTFWANKKVEGNNSKPKTIFKFCKFVMFIHLL